MQIHSSFTNYSEKPPVITMGTFDGIHLGHRALLEEIKKLAKQEDTESLAVTFWPHPRLVLGQDPEKLRLLTTLDEKNKLIDEIGVDHLMVLPFTKELSLLSSKEFTEEVLVKKLRMKHLVVGFNHKFGSDGITFTELEELALKHNFKLSQFHHVDVKGDHPSSTQIRHHLLAGNINKANHLLGYSYTITGKIVEGNKLGRTISYPTANVNIQEKCKLVPLDGVYACRVKVLGKEYGGMVNIGVRPTVSKQLDFRTVEVHILDFSEDVYNKEISILFEERIRDEMKFENIEALKAQLKLDEVTIRTALNKLN